MTFPRMLWPAVGALALSVAGVAPAGAVSLDCVGGPGCSSSLQAAVDAASSGDTIRISAGTFAGGVRIGKSLRLVGAGAARTTIRGGGPVLTITTSAAVRPTVVISGVTITGGVSHGDGVQAGGGGLLVSPGPGDAVGARVTLRNVVVTRNRTAPTTVSPSPSGVKCPNGDCPYAGSFGGGISSFGTLTLDHSVVSHNDAVGVASDADGGGIFSAFGGLTLLSSVVDHNRAAPERIGRFAEGGGVFVASGGLTVRDSRISNNRTDLVTSWPIRPQGVLLDMSAHGAGLQVGDGALATIERTTITGNSVLADDPAGEIYGFDAALLVGDRRLVMRHTVITGNSVVVRTATSEDVGPSGTAVEVDGPADISETVISNNPVSVTSPRGVAQASAGLAVYDFAGNPRQVTLREVRISGNSAVARSPEGSAQAFGGGVFTNSLLDLRDSVVRGNTVKAQAPQALAQGGGIWNGPFLTGPPVVLTLHDTDVVANTATTSPGGTAQGGGIYTTEPVTLTASRVARNNPDQCHGCAGGAAAAAAAAAAAKGRAGAQVRR